MAHDANQQASDAIVCARIVVTDGEVHWELPNYRLPDYIPAEWHDRITVIMDRRGLHYLWTGWNTGEGHGKARVAGRTVYCYRWVWEKVTGRAIPKGHVIDHTCTRKPCINFACLEAVTTGTNTSRGPGRYHQFKRREAYE